MLEEAGSDRAQGGPPRADAEGHAQDRLQRAARPVRQAGQGQGRPAPDRPPRPGHERTYETKPYEFGDPFNLDMHRTIRNAMRRNGGGTPVQLSPDDFEIERTEHLTRSSTVLMLDLSLSMPMRDNFLAAKKVAMALHSLISSQFPRDYLGIVGFSEMARVLTAAQLPEVSWDFVYGTNMQHGFLLARQLLARQTGTKQIIMITDGEPTAHITPTRRRVLQLPAGARDHRGHAARGRALHAGRHPHQHVHARRQQLPQAVRREAHADQPRPGVLHHARDPRRLRAGRLHRAQEAAGPRPGRPPRRLTSTSGGTFRHRTGRFVALRE